MSALSEVLLFKPFQKQGGANIETQQVNTNKKTAILKRIVAHLMEASNSDRTSEEWQRLESKKQIKTSEQIRTYMRNH